MSFFLRLVMLCLLNEGPLDFNRLKNVKSLNLRNTGREKEKRKKRRLKCLLQHQMLYRRSLKSPFNRLFYIGLAFRRTRKFYLILIHLIVDKLA